jgi:hypothetical protein
MNSGRSVNKVTSYKLDERVSSPSILFFNSYNYHYVYKSSGDHTALIQWKEEILLRGRPRHRLEDIIRLDRTEIGWEGVDWTHLAHDRDQWRAVVNTVMKPRYP